MAQNVVYAAASVTGDPEVVEERLQTDAEGLVVTVDDGPARRLASGSGATDGLRRPNTHNPVPHK